MIETIIQNLVELLDNWMVTVGPLGPLLVAIVILAASLFVVQISLQLLAMFFGLG